MPADKPSKMFTNFAIEGQQYGFKQLFYGVSIRPAAFSLFTSGIFKPPIRKTQNMSSLYDVFIQDEMKDNVQNLEKYH